MAIYKDSELLELDPVEVYKLVINESISKFPCCFFKRNGKVRTQIAKPIIVYLIEERLQWTRDDVCKNYGVDVFDKNRLRGFLNVVFDGIPYAALNNAYPDEYKPWELKSVQHNYWNIKTISEAIYWIVEEKLKGDRKTICEEFDINLLRKYGLYGMINKMFNGSPYNAINLVYPNQYKPWEFKYVPRNFWNVENARSATRWLIDEKLIWSEEDVYEKYCLDIFIQNGLLGMINIIYDWNAYNAIDDAYPGKYTLEKFKHIRKMRKSKDIILL